MAFSRFSSKTVSSPILGTHRHYTKSMRWSFNVCCHVLFNIFLLFQSVLHRIASISSGLVSRRQRFTISVNLYSFPHIWSVLIKIWQYFSIPSSEKNHPLFFPLRLSFKMCMLIADAVNRLKKCGNLQKKHGILIFNAG